MKKLSLFLIVLSLSFSSISQSNDPVILTINGENVYQSEFMYIYGKNNENPSFAKDSLDEYMDLFINYKLKVKEAERLKYDTLPQLVSELAQYRKQLALPYMVDKDKNEALIKEAYERTVNEVRASHILIRVNENAEPADTNAAYVKAMGLKIRIENGEEFEKVARSKGGSEDPSVAMNGGDLGYFSAMQMVYPFEDAAFNTPVGTVSMPIRTKFGYHLIYVTDKRKAVGMIETAHILILSGENSAKEDQLKAEQKINEIYQLLESGEETFENLAVKYSEDQSSKAKGGLLPIFGAGSKQRMVPVFEEAAYALKNDGDFSKPIKTAYGYHIIKRIQVIPVPSYEKMYRELKLKVERDMRSESTISSFVNELKKDYNYTDNAQKLLPMFYNTMGDDIYLGKWKGLEDQSHASDILFSFADRVITIQDFESYIIRNQKKMPRQDLKAYVKGQFNRLVQEEIIAYEDLQLERKYPEFKSLITEYSDGILVFEIMQNEIWKKASKDTTGIRLFYESNKDQFTFPLRYKGDLYTCNDKKTAKLVSKMVKAKELAPIEIEEALNENSQLNVKAKTQTFSSEGTAAFEVEKKGNKQVKTFKQGLNKAYKNNELYYVFNVEEVLEPRNREFSESKGLVTAAYQAKLEKDWLSSLRQQYKIEIKKDVLYGLGTDK